MKFAKRKVAALIPLVVVTGCSGGDSESLTNDPPPPARVDAAPVAGYWQGTATHPFAPEPTATYMYADDTGDLHLVVTPFPPIISGPITVAGLPFVLYGNGCCETQIEIEAKAVNELEMTQTPVQITMQIDGESLIGSFEYEGRSYALSLTRLDSYRTPLSLDDLAGVYTGTYSWYYDTPKNWTLVIQENGTVTGVDDYGCNWLGAASVPNTARNMFHLTIDAGGCSEVRLAPLNGSYTGLGKLTTNRPGSGRYPGQDTIEFSLVGPMWFGEQTLAR